MLIKQQGSYNNVKIEIPEFTGDLEFDAFLDELIKCKKFLPTRRPKIHIVLLGLKRSFLSMRYVGGKAGTPIEKHKGMTW